MKYIDMICFQIDFFFFFGKKYCNEFRIIQYDVRKEISS